MAEVGSSSGMRAFLKPSTPRRGSVVGATYSLPVEQLSKDQMDEETKRLTMQAKNTFGCPPPPFAAYFVQDGRLHCPRFYGMERFGPAETDERVRGEPAPRLTFEGQLKEVQTRASELTLARQFSEGGCGGAIVSLPCGYGKTVFAVHMMSVLKRKTAVLVHKEIIRDQWVEAVRRFSPGATIGFVQGKTWDVEGKDVVLVMIMTLAKREVECERLDAFGFVVVDEAHHLAAPVMNKAVRSFRSHFVLGLTATKERPDGLTPLLNWALGEDGFKVERSKGVESVKVKVVHFKDTTREILSRDGKPLVALMLNQIASHARRNQHICDLVCRMRREEGRTIMILSDRLTQLRSLRHLLLQAGIEEASVGLFTGETKTAERAEQMERSIVLCSYGMANEGVDKKEADTVVMATPKGRVVQCIGRIQRPCETKQHPLVIDVVDEVSVFKNLAWKRARLYADQGYEVEQEWA